MKIMVALLLVISLLPAVGSRATEQPSGVSTSQPDILFILSDDMTEADWRSLSRTKELLPAVFPNFVNVDPLCCPSRATILRGQYPHTHGTLRNKTGPDGGRESFLDQEGQTIAVELQRTGYRTGLIGKYLNGYSSDESNPPGWDYWFAQIDTKDQYFNWIAVEGNQVHSYGDEPPNYSTDILADKAANFINGAPLDQPLFAYVAPYAPHEPGTPAPRHVGTCDNESLGSMDKPSLNELEMGDKPRYMQGDPLPVEELTAFDRQRQCSLKAVDELVVTLITALETRGRPYDVLFASDNGYLMGEHRRVGKLVPYEESIRTTMRAAGPDFPAGEDSRLVANVDLAPTFAAIAGAPPREDWDGRSMLARENARLDRRLIGIEELSKGAGGEDEGLGKPRTQRSRNPPYSGFRTVDGTVYIEYATGEVELYDLKADPYQLQNLAAGMTALDFPEYHSRLEALRECHAAACWAAEDESLHGGE